MPCNIHPWERAARVVAGLFITSLAFWGPETLWAYLGIVPILTGVLGYCPPYALLGINTCKIKQES